MMFIIFLGIQDKDKNLGTANINCPNCGKFSNIEVHKTYNYFHIFLIPVFRWNIKYIGRSKCCGKLYEIDTDVGKEYERNPDLEINQDNLQPLSFYTSNKYCTNCKVDVSEEYSYCPYCGKNL